VAHSGEVLGPQTIITACQSTDYRAQTKQWSFLPAGYQALNMTSVTA
jgi:hypothetical protein